MREVAEQTLRKMWNDIHTSAEVKSNAFLDINRCGCALESNRLWYPADLTLHSGSITSWLNGYLSK